MPLPDIKSTLSREIHLHNKATWAYYLSQKPKGHAHHHLLWLLLSNRDPLKAMSPTSGPKKVQNLLEHHKQSPQYHIQRIYQRLDHALRIPTRYYRGRLRKSRPQPWPPLPGPSVVHRHSLASYWSSEKPSGKALAALPHQYQTPYLIKHEPTNTDFGKKDLQHIESSYFPYDTGAIGDYYRYNIWTAEYDGMVNDRPHYKKTPYGCFILTKKAVELLREYLRYPSPWDMPS